MGLPGHSHKLSGYRRHDTDVEGTCFYCGEEAKYKDYMPPRDVESNQELRKLVTVPFVYVSTCHNCKTAMYPKRYHLLTPENRRTWFLGRKQKKSRSLEDVAAQLRGAALSPWQRRDQETGLVYDLDDQFLEPEVVKMKHGATCDAPSTEPAAKTDVDDDYLGLKS